MAKKYYFARLYEDFFNQKEIKKIRKMEEGDTYTVIYLKLVLSSIKNEGRIYYESIEETLAEEIALMIDEETANVQKVLNILLSMKIIEETEYGIRLPKVEDDLKNGCSSKTINARAGEKEFINYYDYLLTDHWKETREKALKAADYKCQLCSSKENLNVHHNNYDHLYHETEKDLVVLCHNCHARFHGKEGK